MDRCGPCVASISRSVSTLSEGLPPKRRQDHAIQLKE